MAATTDVIQISDIDERYEKAKAKLESLEVTSDEEYVQACELAKAIAATEKELAETEEVQEKKRLYKEYKKLSSLESAVASKLKEIKDIVRAHIGAYAVRKDHEALDDQTEKAIQAALATGDDSFLDMIIPHSVLLPQVPGVQFAEVTDFEIEDPEALPDTLKVPDTKAVRKMVQALGTEADIPGVRVFRKKQVRVSAS